MKFKDLKTGRKFWFRNQLFRKIPVQYVTGHRLTHVGITTSNCKANAIRIDDHGSFNISDHTEIDEWFDEDRHDRVLGLLSSFDEHITILEDKLNDLQKSIAEAVCVRNEYRDELDRIQAGEES